MKDIDKGIAIGMLMGRKTEAKLGTKTATQNGTYTASSESPSLDGYSVFTVAVPIESATFTDNGTYTAQNGGYNPVVVDVDTYEDEYQAALARIAVLEDELANMGTKTITVNGTYAAASDNYTGYTEVTVNVPQSAAVTTAVTFTANGTYTPPSGVDGYDSVTVDTPYEQEWQQMKACQAEIAAKLGLTEPYDCQDIEDAIDEQSGYEFPAGTAYDPDIINIVGGDNVTDETLGYTLYSEIGLAWDVMTQQYQNPYLIWGIIDSNGNYTQFGQNAYGGAYPMIQVESYCITNSVTGEWTITYINPFGRRQTSTGTSQDLIGFGDTGHTYKVHKSIPKNV